MRREKYVYNPATLQYEKHTIGTKGILFRLTGYACAVVLSGLIMITLMHEYFPSQHEQALQRDLEQMEYQYLALNDQINIMNKVLNNVQDRDANVHRVLFGMDPIDDNIWNGGIGGHDRYQNLTDFKHAPNLVKNVASSLDKLEHQIYLQSKSLDTIQKMTMEREEMLASVPSIKPIRVDRLKRGIHMLSGFGMRFHPVHKVLRMHKGLDFTSPTGTAIQATGNGTIIKVRKSRTGYGRHVVIDHGFGYKTLYAHMKDIEVQVGDKVLKGQRIGTVGNTGTSTAPHLHYEVHYMGKAVNPIHYCMDGLTPEEYQELVEHSERSGQSFD